MQFHPTALHLEGRRGFCSPKPCAAKAPILRNTAGERFMERYHPLRELAPRDVVARAIVAEMAATGAPHVLLDLSHREPGFRVGAFPANLRNLPAVRRGSGTRAGSRGSRGALRHGRRPHRSGRARPASRLYAAGEVACTGVHGANRLASNSLLEGVVFGARAARAMAKQSSHPPGGIFAPPESHQCGPGCKAHHSGCRYSDARLALFAGSSCDGAGLAKATRLGGPDGKRGHGGGGVRAGKAKPPLADHAEDRGVRFRTDLSGKAAEFLSHSNVKRGSAVEFI